MYGGSEAWSWSGREETSRGGSVLVYLSHGSEHRNGTFGSPHTQHVLTGCQNQPSANVASSTPELPLSARIIGAPSAKPREMTVQRLLSDATSTECLAAMVRVVGAVAAEAVGFTMDAPGTTQSGRLRAEASAPRAFWDNSAIALDFNTMHAHAVLCAC